MGAARGEELPRQDDIVGAILEPLDEPFDGPLDEVGAEPDISYRVEYGDVGQPADVADVAESVTIGPKPTWQPDVSDVPATRWLCPIAPLCVSSDRPAGRYDRTASICCTTSTRSGSVLITWAP